MIFFGFLDIALLWCKENTVSPAPAYKLTELLKNEQVQNTARRDFIVVVIGNSVPVEAIKGLREGDDKRDGEGIRVSEYLVTG